MSILCRVMLDNNTINISILSLRLQHIVLYNCVVQIIFIVGISHNQIKTSHQKPHNDTMVNKNRLEMP